MSTPADWSKAYARQADAETAVVGYDELPDGWLGLDIGPDKIHVMIDNGHSLRHTYCHRRHRYVIVDLGPNVAAQTQQRSDYEIEGLAWALRDGKLKVGWE
jgi:hypothetical protein